MITIPNEKIKYASYYLIDNYPFWGEILLSCNISESNSTHTMGVNYTEKGMNLVYKKDFVDTLSQPNVNFIILHEVLHLISNHQQRAVYKSLNRKKANKAGDMIINLELYRNMVDDKNVIPPTYTKEDIEEEKEKLIKLQSLGMEISKEDIDSLDENIGKFTGLLLPEDYNGKETLEAVYEYLYDDEENDGESDIPNLDNRNDLDEDLQNEIPPEQIDSIIEEIKERSFQRGTFSSNAEALLNKLRHPSKNYLSKIKSSIEVLGNSKKYRTWQRFGRRGEMSRGKRKYKIAFNVILDVSGSMSGLFEKTLSYIFKNGYECNLIQVDTEVKAVEKIKSKKQLQSLQIKGLGGTTLQPAIDLVAEKYNKLTTIIMTDGYTDNLDFSKINKNTLILTTDAECIISGGSNKVKQIVID